VEKISLETLQQPRFNPTYDEPLVVELAEHESGVVWVCKQVDWPVVQARIHALGYRATLLGTPYQHRVMFEVHRQDETGQRAAPATAR
jgi:hypothetical protein